MRGGKAHVVVGIGNNITYGAHYLSTAVLERTIVQSIHCVVCGTKFTNADHGEEVMVWLQRLLRMWTAMHVEMEESGVKEGHAHLPDLSTWDGVYMFVMVCNFLLLWPALRMGVYAEETHNEEDYLFPNEEMYFDGVQREYRYLKNRIRGNNVLTLDGNQYDWDKMFWVR